MSDRPAARRSTLALTLAAIFVALVLAASLAPTLLAPRSAGTLAVVIATTELSPLVALAAVVAAVVAMLATRGRPALRSALPAIALVAAILATGPARRAARAARAVAPQLEALGTGRPLASPGVRWGAGLARPAVPAPVEVRAITTRADDGTLLHARLLRAATPAHAPRPAIVAIYGGAWQRGSATANEATNRRLAALGYVVLAVDYRHAPQHPWPAARDDVRRALAMLADSATAWGVDPARVALWGRSSGAHLALRTAWDTAALPVRVRGVVDYYGPYDLAAGYADPPHPDPLDVRAILRAFVGDAPDARAAAYRDASPSTLVRPGLPPTLLVYGRRDHIVLARFGRDAADALRRAGNAVVHLELPDAEHAFDAVPNGVDAQAAGWAAEAFLARVLR